MNLIASIVGLTVLPLFFIAHVATGGESNSSTIQPKMSEFKLNLHRFLEGSRIRKKRQLPKYDGGPPSQEMRVGSTSQAPPPYLSGYTLTFWTSALHAQRRHVLAGTEEGNLMLFELSEADEGVAKMVALSTNEVVAHRATAFSHYDEQWFAVLQSSADKIWIRVYLRVGRGLERRQTIPLDGETEFNLVTVKGVHYLTVVTFRSSTNQGVLSLYHWTKTQFDVIASRSVYGARSVTTWVMDGSLYFAVAQEMNEEGNFRVGSPIFLFNAKEENKLVLLDMLATNGPKKVLHFSVGGSQYVLFVGRDEAIIYWWSSDQFLFWQRIDGTAHASGGSVLALENGEVALVIVLKEEALFLTLDSSGHYYVRFTLLLSGIDLKSLQFMYSGKAYYALALSKSALADRPQPLWKLTLYPYTTSLKSSLEPLHTCLNDLAGDLDRRQLEVNRVHSDLGRVWLRNKNQTVTAEIITNEMTSPQPSSITEILIVTSRKILPDSSLPLIAEGISRLEALVGGIQQNIKNSVLKSFKQEIKGNKHFKDSIFIPSLNMDSTNIDVPINDVPVSRIQNYALRKVGDQTFHHSVNVGNINAEQITTSFLNGILFEDLLQLTGTQEITGGLKFIDMSATDIGAQNINTISVEDFVTTYSEQTLRDLKHMTVLQSSLIGVQGQTNGEDMKEFYGKIITINDDYRLKERLNFESQVHVYGDIFLRSVLNGRISISELVDNTIRKNGDQNFKGHLTFTSPVHILGDMNSAGLINDINIADLVTLSSDQVIHADVTFYELLTVDRDLLVELVNGIDLDKTAVLKTTEPQFLFGFKTFSDQLVVDFVEMTDYVTLDGVDPSLLVQDIVKHKEGVVENDGTIFHNVVVLGNVTAVEGVNGHNVFDLPDIVWLKSASQDIVVPVNIEEISVKEVEVNVVNNYFVEKDLVFTYTDETIVSVKNFIHNVTVVENVNTEIGGQINGLDVIVFTKEMERYEKEGTIWGKKQMQTLEIYGDIEVEDLNGLPLDNILKPHSYQEIQGHVQFSSELTLIPDDLKTKSVRFNTFNSNDLRDLTNVIHSKTPQHAVKNKAFTKITAENVLVHDGGLLNGIPLSAMLERIVTLNTHQNIQSHKSFLDPIYMLSVSTASLNGRELPSLAHNVVLTDEASNTISPKVFTGKVQTENFFIAGSINGVNFDSLSRNVFYKSLDNHVLLPVHFQQGIFLGKLATQSLLDGVRWNDLIFTYQDEVLDHVQFLGDAVLNSHLGVGGLFNGCDLFQLGQRALYANKSSQHIREEVTIQSIEIKGNLNLKNVVNEIPIEELQRNFITITGDQVVTSDFHLGSGFEVENLYFGDLTNNVNIPLILSDAVRHSTPQEIVGYKHFHDLRSTVLAAREAIVIESLDGVEVTEVYANAVWKQGYQVIEGEKIFHSLKTDVATIHGYINGMRLPDDAILTHTSEHVMGPTLFTSDLVAVTDVVVDGRIDGVLLPSLIESRVTLAGKDLVKSRLSFLQDATFYGDLLVEGTVNDLVLQLVCQVKQHFSLDGHKVFIQDVHVLGSVSASSVNGYDVQQLDRSIVRRGEEEFLNELQVFEKPLRVQSSLFAGWINNISIADMTSTYFSIIHNTHQTLRYYDDLAYGIRGQIASQIETTKNRISRLAYFILVQEINIGPTTKILHGYRLEHASSEFSHSLVLWTTRKHCTYLERCCHVQMSNWMRVKRTGHLVVDSAAEEGRVYPIHDSAPVVTVDKDFVVWTNATQVQHKWCGNHYDETMFIASMTVPGHFQVIMNIRKAPELSDVKSFRQGHLYAVAGYFYDKYEDEYSSSIVYVFNEIQRTWNEFQILPSFGVLSLDVTYHLDGSARELLLAIGTGTGTYSSVYIWNDVENGFELMRNIPSTYVTSTLFVKHEFNQLLAMASVDHWPKKGEDCLEFLSGGEINIYAYKKREMKWIQSIPLKGVVSMVTFTLEGDTFLVAASHQLQTIFIYEWKGYAGFSQTQTIFVGEVRHINTYTIGDDRYLTVAVTSGPSKILKVVVRGRHAVTTARRRDPSLQEDQKDEASLEDPRVPAC